MASLRFLLATVALPCVLGTGACSSEADNGQSSAGAYSEPSDNGGADSVIRGNVAGSRNSARAGSPSRSDDQQDVEPAGTDVPPASVENGGSAGAPEDEEPELTKSCDLNSSCTAKCEDTTVTCGFVSTGHACEFEGFIGATAEVSCGQRVVVGTACCGGCGCIPVELYFDGKHCWQGIPQCTLDNFSNQVFAPHPTTTANPSFVPPPYFHLGSGGFGGSPALGTGGLGFGGGLGGLDGDAGAPAGAGGGGGVGGSRAGSAGDDSHAGGGGGGETAAGAPSASDVP